MNTLKHNGYTARIDFDETDNIFTGRLLGITDVITFHGETVAELRSAFVEAVDDYLDLCAKIGKEPLKPASGKMMLRIPPAVHAAVMRAAELEGKSINQWATEALQAAVHG